MSTMPFETYPIAPGSPLRALLPEEGTARFDPFLVFHEQGPVVYGPGEAVGFPDHPHRGFETITYVVAGEQAHRDSFGHAGVLRAGDVQWMTAARGIVHSELPTPALFRDGGLVHAMQIWVNLPAARKMERPRYQDVAAEALPVIETPRTWIRVVAGSVGGVASPVDAGRPFLFAHVRLRAGATPAFAVPAGATVLVYATAGAVAIDDAALGARRIAVLRDRTRDITLAAGGDAFEGVILAAVPLREPVVSRGPFVMNTRREIDEAYDALMNGTLGAEAITT